MFAPFHFRTPSGERSRSFFGDFAADDSGVVIAAELLDDSTTLLLCRSTQLIREDDERGAVIRRVDRCREGRLLRFTFDECRDGPRTGDRAAVRPVDEREAGPVRSPALAAEADSTSSRAA